MTMSFNDIPISVNTPGAWIEVDNSRAVQGTPAKPHKVLFIGFGNGGSLAELTPTRTLSPTQAEDQAGVYSPTARMVEAYKKVDPLTETWLCLVDPEAGTAATGNFSITGTATEAGELALYIGGRRYPVAVAIGDTGDDVVAAAATKIAEDARRYTNAAAGTPTTQLDVTARWAGTSGNDIDLRHSHRPGEKVPAGLTVAVTDMASGATDPDMADVVTAIGDTQYDTIVSMFNADAAMDDLEAELLSKWGPMQQKEGHLFAAVCDTVANSTTAGNARNSQFSTLVAGQQTPTPQWIVAAQAAARDAAQTQIDPARPRQTLELPDVLAPAIADRWTREERDIALTDGLATVVYGDYDDRCRIERLTTTYQTNAGGTPDKSYLDITTMRTLAFLRYSLRTRVQLRYPRHKLADDGTLFSPGQAIVTPSVIKAEIVALFREWERDGLVEGGVQFKEELLVERDGSDPNRVNVRLSPDLINQFRVFAGQIQFLL